MSNITNVHQAPASDQGVEQSLYAKRERIYPREVHGLYARLRLIGILSLLGIYYWLPWVPWDGRQAVLFDLPARKFYVFGLTFWPQDFIYLALLLAIAGLSLFFFTAVAGRLWCGYACPQTVWTEVFLWIERWLEGGRMQQMKLDQSPWNLHKLRIKVAKHTIWILFSLYTGLTFVAYFTPVTELASGLVHFALGPWETFWILFYGFATYGNAGWMREQVCIYMCPYARFQSAMFDSDTLIIAYDRGRGEPRGGRKRSDDPKRRGLGDCIDCTLCVQACPTGIDIRDGLQYQCIGCAACIDACDEVMDKMGYASGLVRYTSEQAVAGRPSRLLRPRVLIYAALLAAMVAGLGLAMGQRTALEIDVLRDRNRLYGETAAGLIENVYTLKIINKTDQAGEYRLSASGIDGLRLITDQATFHVPGGEVLALGARLQANAKALPSRSTSVEFRVSEVSSSGSTVTHEARFLGPFTN